MRKALYDDSEEELTHFSELIAEYQVSRRVSLSGRLSVPQMRSILR